MKLFWIVPMVLSLLLWAGVTAYAASAQKPPSPPGQGECQHGNSGKECRPDPQPDRGKDCEEHGPKEGGVNEDHCGPAPEDPVEPPVDPPVDPPTTTEEEPSTPTPEQPTPPSSTPSTPVETPTTPTATPTPPTTPPTEPPSPPSTGTSRPSVTPKELEEQLEEQAKENGATSTSTTATTAAPDTLPRTGLPLALWALLGAALVGTGSWMRRRS